MKRYISTDPIKPIQPIACLISGRMWIHVALDKLNSVDYPSYEEQVALELIEEVLPRLNAAVGSLED